MPMRLFKNIISMCINEINSFGMSLSKLVLRPIKPDNYPVALSVFPMKTRNEIIIKNCGYFQVTI